MTDPLRKIFKSYYLKTPFQGVTLEKMLQHAFEHVPFYKPYKGSNITDLPFLSREMLKNEFDNLKSDDLQSRNWFYKFSGGSTGEPVRLIQDANYKKHQRVVTYRQKSWCSYEFGQPMIHLWGSMRDVKESSGSLAGKMINYLKNLKVLNVFMMTEERMHEYIGIINRFRPKLIVAYAQPAYELALFAERKNLEIRPPAAFISSAGTLYPFMKQKIEEVFLSPVYNRYGTREVGNIACSAASHEELRISTDNVFVEVVNEQGEACKDGEEGEVAVTGLVNFAMPLIRYKLGDRAVMNRSKYDFPVLEKLSGRVTDVLKTADGALIPAEYFIHIIGVVMNKGNSWIGRFQVIQKAPEEMELKIIRTGEPVETDLKLIRENIRRVMGYGCKVNFNFVEEIPELKSGKYSYVINEMK
mgnify:CR=1 FL=1